MKVLMFSPAYDHAGGAVIAANRLFHGLLQQGHQAKMLVGRSSFENERVKVIPHNLPGEKILSRFTTTLGLNYIHYYSTYRLTRHPFFREADILNFHTIHSGYFNYRALPKLTAEKPAVYTLHDVWSFTGHCGFNFDCEKWKTGCGNCPYPDSYPSIKYDNTALEWKLKRKAYEQSRLTFVTPSHWLTDLARQSMLGNFDIHTIPNGLDTTVFTPLDKERCRHELKIPPGKKVLLFGAMGLADPRKGGDLLIKTLAEMPESLKKEVLLLTFGQSDETFRKSFDMEALHLGYVSDDQTKAKIYSAADVFIFPTRNDNLPCMIQESMACGTPVISFDINGIPDLVRPGQTGYLAEAADAKSLLSRITQLLEENDVRSQMSKACRKITLAEYDVTLQAQRYVELFRRILAS